MANPTYASPNFATTLNVGGGINNSQTTGLVLTSVSGLNSNGGILGIDWASTIDTSLYEEVEYTGISGNELTGVTRGVNGFSAKQHNNLAVVVSVVSSIHNNRVADKLTGRDAVLAQDPNGNEIIKTNYNSSAVNEVTVTNAATANAPQIAATGGDTNIDLNLVSKGTGAVKINGVSYAPGTTDGWLSSSDTFVYVSASSFKISGVDRTATYTKGTRVKFTNNSITVYGVVASSAFSTDTTVTLIANSDYSINNSAITNPFYSYFANPQGYPGWFAYATTWGGFSANPTGSFRFSVVGKLCVVEFIDASAGTSNATTLTFTLPVAAVNSQVAGAMSFGTDNGAAQSTPGHMTLNSSSTTVNVFKSFLQGAWTNSGQKAIFFTNIAYEF